MGPQTLKLLIHFARANQRARSKILQTLQQASKYANEHTWLFSLQMYIQNWKKLIEAFLGEPVLFKLSRQNRSLGIRIKTTLPYISCWLFSYKRWVGLNSEINNDHFPFNQSFILTRCVKELKNSFKIRTCINKIYNNYNYIILFNLKKTTR